LLHLLSLACLFIPLTTLLTLAIPSLGLWEFKGFGAIMVELVALVFSGLFYYAALKTKRRAFYGERNSIWALPVTKAIADKKLILIEE